MSICIYLFLITKQQDILKRGGNPNVNRQYASGLKKKPKEVKKQKNIGEKKQQLEGD